MRLVPRHADIDMSLVPEQRGRPRFIAQQGGIAAQIGAAQLDPLARFGQQAHQIARSGRGARLVISAEEEDAALFGHTARAPSEFVPFDLHGYAIIGR